jgi:hypothetical protein
MDQCSIHAYNYCSFIVLNLVIGIEFFGVSDAEENIICSFDHVFQNVCTYQPHSRCLDFNGI